MLYIEDNVIYITRGDDGEIDISLVDSNNEPYELLDGDKLTLTVSAAPGSAEDVVFAAVSSGFTIPIMHEHTANAEIGAYSADIELLTANGARKTIWPKLEGNARMRSTNFKNFVIMPEV